MEAEGEAFVNEANGLTTQGDFKTDNKYLNKLGIFSWNDCFPYPTVKYVHVENALLGGCNYFNKLMIFGYIVVYMMLYENLHLKTSFELGDSTAGMWHPTHGDCDPLSHGCAANFPNMDTLPYCKQDPRNKAALNVHECKPFSSFELNPNTVVPNTYLIPTKIVTTVNKKGCTPSAENDWTCKDPETLWISQKKEDEKHHYVGEIENFTIHLVHFIGGNLITGLPKDTPGFLVMKNFQLLPGKGSALQLGVRNHERHRRPAEHDEATDHSQFSLAQIFDSDSQIAPTPAEAKKAHYDNELEEIQSHLPKFYSVPKPIMGAPPGWRIPEGTDATRIPNFKNVWFDKHRAQTVLGVGDLFKLARHDGHLDHNNPHKDGLTFRDTGGCIEVIILYSNLCKWDFLGVAPVHYNVYARIAKEAHDFTETYVDIAKSTADTQYIIHKTGFLLKIRVHAQIARWNSATLSTTMAEALALLAVSLMLSDLMMCYLPIFSFRQDRIGIVKYQPWAQEVCTDKEGLYEGAENVLPQVLAGAAAEDRDLTPEELLCVLCMLDRRMSRIDGFSVEAVRDPTDKRVQFIKAFEEEYLEKLHTGGS